VTKRNNENSVGFDKATEHQVKYDVIGLSYYPFDQERLFRNHSRFTKSKRYISLSERVMVVEVGGVDEQVQNTKTAATIKVIAVPDNKGLAFCI
jgi:arabinogalactan endo-1,4-beta-galactosidase